MALTVAAVSPEDISSLLSITTAAFNGSTNRILFHTLPLSESSVKFLEDHRLKALTGSSNVRNFKVVDTATGEVVGGAKWTVYESDETEKDLKQQVGVVLEGTVPESRVDAVRAFYSMLFQVKRELLGYQDDKVVKLKRRVDLDMLYTHPKHQGRGAAKLLMQRCVDEADRLDLDIYLEATESGRPVYEKLGFRAIKEVEFDMKDYGGEDIFKFTVRFPNGNVRQRYGSAHREAVHDQKSSFLKGWKLKPYERYSTTAVRHHNKSTAKFYSAEKLTSTPAHIHLQL